MKLERIYISPGHNFFGRYGKTPDDHPVLEVEEVECVAGSGLRGDRFFNYRPDYKGQVTFFSREVHDAVCSRFQLADLDPWAYRRNLIVSGVDLNTLVGTEFTLQGVRFQGIAEATPCAWMNQAVAEGAEEFLKGRGGLRAKILTNGFLQTET